MDAASAVPSRCASSAASATSAITTASSSRESAVDRKRFERHVADALASIPRRFRQAMQNLAIVVEDEPGSALLDEMGIEPPDTLLGLYQGTPLTQRGWDY